MNKALEALMEIKRQIGNIHYFDFTQNPPRMTTIPLINTPFFDIIENALKRLEGIDDKKVVYMTRTQGQAQKVIDELSKHKEVVITNLSDQKKLKALEIIKTKKIDVGLFYTILEDNNQKNKKWSYNFWQEKENKITQKEFDSVKEVLL